MASPDQALFGSTYGTWLLGPLRLKDWAPFSRFPDVTLQNSHPMVKGRSGMCNFCKFNKARVCWCHLHPVEKKELLCSARGSPGAKGSGYIDAAWKSPEDW